MSPGNLCADYNYTADWLNMGLKGFGKINVYLLSWSSPPQVANNTSNNVKKMVHVELWVRKYAAWMGIGITNQLHCVVPLPTPNHLVKPSFLPLYENT
jgi:hypothetical protein